MFNYLRVNRINVPINLLFRRNFENKYERLLKLFRGERACQSVNKPKGDPDGEVFTVCQLTKFKIPFCIDNRLKGGEVMEFLENFPQFKPREKMDNPCLESPTNDWIPPLASLLKDSSFLPPTCSDQEFVPCCKLPFQKWPELQFICPHKSGKRPRKTVKNIKSQHSSTSPYAL